MAKTKIKGIERFNRSIRKRIQRSARKTITSERIAKRIRGLIIRGIKRDLTLPSGERVKSLTKSTAKRRRRLATVNRTDRFYAPFKSNLTFTGRFLKSMKVFVGKKKNVTYTIRPEGVHKGYKLIRGGKSPDVTNAEVGAGLIDSGRDWTKVGDATKDEIKKIITKQVLREIRKAFKS